MPGKFIVFDGIDGSGKTTQLFLAADYLFHQSKQNRVLITREPTMESYGLELRKLLQNTTSTQSTEEVAELFYKDRVFHLDTVIVPALERGHIVLCDRHKYSMLAYQGAGGYDKEKMVSMFKEFRKPDLALIFDLPAKKALERGSKDLSSSRQKPVEGLRVFEQADFLEKARENFLHCQRYFPLEKIRTINADNPVDLVFQDVKRELNSVL